MHAAYIRNELTRSYLDSGDPQEYCGTIHISMVKFSTRDDPGYKMVLYSIEMLLEQLGEDPSKQSV